MYNEKVTAPESPDERGFRFHHLGVAVTNIESALPVYQNLFGYKLLGDPVDDPIQQVTVCFLGRDIPGDLVIELVAPLGANSPVLKTLGKGYSAYHVCYEVDDLPKALAGSIAKGCLQIGSSAPAAAFNQRHIAWLYTPTRQLVELLAK